MLMVFDVEKLVGWYEFKTENIEIIFPLHFTPNRQSS